MDAVEFIKTRARMCREYDGCAECPLDFFCECEEEHQEQDSGDRAIKAVRAVEQWAKEHPVKTRQSEFLKQWPDAEIGDDGLPNVAPCQLCLGLIHSEFPEDCESRGLCIECRRDFWLKEIE